MNKTDLINAIAEKAELTKADAGRALEAYLEAVQKSLKKGEDVSVVGFGTFTVRKRAARTGRNPRTNEASPLQGGGRRFDPYSTHQKKCGVVVQLVRMLACHAGGRGFESRPLRHSSQGRPSGALVI
jgi:DNA-binding protein HU-beta